MRLSTFDTFAALSATFGQHGGRSPIESPMEGLIRNATAMTAGLQTSDFGRMFGPGLAMIKAANSASFLPHSFGGLNWLTGMVHDVSSFDRLVAPLLQIPRWIGESNEAFHGRLERFVAVMNELGWPPPMRMLSSAITEVIDLAEELGSEGAREQVESRIVAAYDDTTLEEMVRSWRDRPGLPPQALAMMIDAVLVFRAGHYTAAVCTGIPAVEAIIMDAWAPRGRVKHSKLQAFVRNAIVGPRADASDRGVAHYLENIHFADFKRGDPIPDMPGRHAVVHGAHTSAGTRANALRVLIFLDLMQDAFTFVAGPRGRLVHLPSCGVGRRLKSGTRRVFHSLAAAQAAGLTRAKCCPDRLTDQRAGSGAR